MTTYKQKRPRLNVKKEYIIDINPKTGITIHQLINYFDWLIKHNAANKYQHQLSSLEIEEAIFYTAQQCWQQMESGNLDKYNFNSIKSYLYRAFNSSLLTKIEKRQKYEQRNARFDSPISPTQTYGDMLSEVIPDDSSQFPEEEDEDTQLKRKALEMAFADLTPQQQEMVLTRSNQTIAKKLLVSIGLVQSVKAKFRRNVVRCYNSLLPNTKVVPVVVKPKKEKKPTPLQLEKEKRNQAIRQDYNSGMKILELAVKYGISRQSISYILRPDVLQARNNKLKSNREIRKIADLKEKKQESEPKLKLDSSLGQKIAELREKALTYKEIMMELGCSKSVINYHLSSVGKEKTRLRTQKHKRNKIYKMLTNTIQKQNKPIERDLYYSQTQICKIYKVTPKKLQLLLKQHNIPVLSKHIDLGEYDVTAKYVTKEQIHQLGLELR